METILFALAMICFIAEILVGANAIKFKNEWLSVVLAWILLAIGSVFFGILLTL